MRTIWKFPFVVTDTVQILMPGGAVVLNVQMQGELPCLWALVRPGAEKEVRYFRIIGTGHPILGEIGDFIGTFQMYTGALVFHMFAEPGEVRP